MTSVRRALALSFLERYLMIMLALASNMILARLLTPAQIGLYSVTLAVIGIAHVLRDFGVGNYLIQQQKLTEAHVRTAFGVSLIIGLMLFGALYMASPAIASFYSEPTMTDLMQTVAVNFLILPFCTVSLALLRRELEFQRLLYVNVAATGVGFVATVGLAYLGWGPVSMAIGAIVSNAATGFGAWAARPGRPLMMPSLSEWRSVLGFGGQNVATSLVTTISSDINDLVVGKVLGFAPVAILSRAQGLMNLFHRDVMAAIRNVAFPALAKSFREGADVDSQHTSGVSAVTACAWPFYGFLALYPLEIIRLMFGDQWDSAASFVPLFCAAGAMYATSNLVFPLVIAVGRVDLVTKAELIFQPVRAILIVMAAYLFESLEACALAYLGSSFLYTPIAYLVKQKCLKTRWSKLANGVSRSALVTLASLVVPATVSLITDTGREVPISTPVLLVVGCFTFTAWAMAMLWLRHPLTLDPAVQRYINRIPSALRLRAKI